jgi:hypothetical protein
MAETNTPRRPTSLDYLTLYALYVVLIVLGVVVVFGIWRSVILVVLAVFVGSSDANRLVYLVTLILLGLVLFVFIMAAEPYLRRGLQRRHLLPSFGRLALPLVIAGALGLLLLALL